MPLIQKANSSKSFDAFMSFSSILFPSPTLSTTEESELSPHTQGLRAAPLHAPTMHLHIKGLLRLLFVILGHSS